MNTSTSSTLKIVFFTILLDMLGIGILIPVIPQLLANPSSEYFLLPQGWSYESGLVLLGLLTASFPFAQFFATPILGQLSDKFGRRSVLSISLVGTAFSYVLFALAIILKNIPLLFFSRIVDGITGGNIAVAQAVISDISHPEDRAKNFGLIGAAFGLGFILGPYLGGKLSDPSVFSWANATTPFYLAAILSTINTLFVWFKLPETNQHIHEDKTVDWNKSIHNIGKALHMEGVRPLLFTNFLFQGGFTFFTTFAAVFFMTKFHATQGNIGDYFAYIGVWIVITQALITRRISKKFSGKAILRVTLLVTSICITLQAFTYPLSIADLTHFSLAQNSTLFWFIHGNMLLVLLISPLFAISNGLTQANMNALISRSSDAKSQGEILGINSSVQALAQSIPGVLSGIIAASITPSAPMVVAGVIIFLAWVSFVVWYRR